MPQSNSRVVTSRSRNGSRGLIGISPRCGPDADQRLLVGFDAAIPIAWAASKYDFLFVHADDAITVGFTRNHPNAGQHSFHFAPFDGERKHSPEDLKFAVHGGTFIPVSWRSGVAGNLFTRNGVERLIRDGRILQ